MNNTHKSKFAIGIALLLGIAAVCNAAPPKGVCAAIARFVALDYAAARNPAEKYPIHKFVFIQEINNKVSVDNAMAMQAKKLYGIVLEIGDYAFYEVIDEALGYGMIQRAVIVSPKNKVYWYAENSDLYSLSAQGSPGHESVTFVAELSPVEIAACFNSSVRVEIPNAQFNDSEIEIARSSGGQIERLLTYHQ